jgi:hypothetical protein
LARSLPAGQRAPTALEQASGQSVDPKKPVSSKSKKRPPQSQPKNETASPAAKKPTNWTIKKS